MEKVMFLATSSSPKTAHKLVSLFNSLQSYVMISQEQTIRHCYTGAPVWRSNSQNIKLKDQISFYGILTHDQNKNRKAVRSLQVVVETDHSASFVCSNREKLSSRFQLIFDQ